MTSDGELLNLYVPPEMLAHLQSKLASVAPSILRRQIAEFLKFLLIAGLENCGLPGQLPVSKEIDAIWHEWILETRKYEALCLKSAGRFIHHNASDVRSPVISRSDPDLERHFFFLVAYVLNFGRFDKERLRYWPAAEEIMRLYHLTLEQLNDLAQDLGATAEKPPHLGSRIPHVSDSECSVAYD